jgi:tetratricopeptide (TPR) repeat protein
MSNSQSAYKINVPFLRSAAAAYDFDNILHPDYEITHLSAEEIKLFSGNYKMEVDKTVKIFEDNNKLVYKTIFDELKQLDYVGNNIMIDINRTVKIEFREDSSELHMNEKKLERLNDGEKLASDYIEEDNIEQAVRCYQELMEKDKNMKDQLENMLNNDGYNCMSRKNHNTAIALLKINTILFHESANSWDSLGEAYFSNKQYELSIDAMKKSLEFNPSNQNAIQIIKDAKEHLEKRFR